MGNQTRLRASVVNAMKTAAPWVARLAGVAAIVLGAKGLWHGIGQRRGFELLESVLLIVLGLGIFMLRKTALKLGTILAAALAILMPLAAINPFAAIDLPSAQVNAPGFERAWIIKILGATAGLVILAHFLGLARMRVHASRQDGQPPESQER